MAVRRGECTKWSTTNEAKYEKFCCSCTKTISCSHMNRMLFSNKKMIKAVVRNQKICVIFMRRTGFYDQNFHL